MNYRKLKAAGALCAVLCLAQPQIAMAQDCVRQADVVDATIYSMPILYDAYTSKCAGEFSETGFIASRGQSFIAPYAAQQDQRWAGAARLLGQFASSGSGGGAGADIFTALPEEAMRPFVDGIIALKIGEEIKLKDCGKIERTAELLSPLPPENVGGFLALLIDFAGVKDPEICPYKAK